MKAPPIEKFVLVVGVALAFIAGLSVLLWIVPSKGPRDSVIESVGYWPLLTVFLSLLSGYCFLGAEPLANAIGRKKPDEHDDEFRKLLDEHRRGQV
jgi:hypothetical protein